MNLKACWMESSRLQEEIVYSPGNKGLYTLRLEEDEATKAYQYVLGNKVGVVIDGPHHSDMPVWTDKGKTESAWWGTAIMTNGTKTKVRFFDTSTKQYEPFKLQAERRGGAVIRVYGPYSDQDTFLYMEPFLTMKGRIVHTNLGDVLMWGRDWGFLLKDGKPILGDEPVCTEWHLLRKWYYGDRTMKFSVVTPSSGTLVVRAGSGLGAEDEALKILRLMGVHAGYNDLTVLEYLSPAPDRFLRDRRGLKISSLINDLDDFRRELLEKSDVLSQDKAEALEKAIQIIETVCGVDAEGKA